MNKKISIFLILLMTVLFSFGFAQEKISIGAKTVNKMKFEKISLNIPQIGKDVERYVMPNGMICFIKPDKSLPLINIDIIVKAGEMYEDKNKHGVAALCSSLIRNGGTENYNPEEVNKQLDYRDINIGFSSSSDSITGNLNALSKDFDIALKIFADMLINPSFDKNKFEIDKIRFIDGIERIKDQPSTLVKVDFAGFIYGNHPYGWKYKKEAVEKINTDDLSAWHKKYFAPNNIMMAVSGDFDVKELKMKLNNVFGAWQSKKIDFPVLPGIKEVEKKECLIVNKEISQSYIRMGNLGIKADNPDLIPLVLTNEIFGGSGFNARLMYELREKRGLTYGAYSAFQTSKRDTGLFVIMLSTSTKNTYNSVNLILKLIEDLQKNGVTDKELKLAKDSYINTFVFNLNPTSSMLMSLMSLEYYNLPADFYANYIKNVEKVTKEDILRCARTYLHPEKIKVVIVGNEKEIKADVEKLIPVIK